MKTKLPPAFFELSVATADGDFLAHYSEKGLAALDFPGATPRRRDPPAATPPPQILNWHRLTSRALADALAGVAPDQLPPLDLSAGTEFQRRVWNTLNQIDSGTTRSYSEIAQALGQPNATRAVGGACGANPIPVLVPCHRVLAAHARLGGFSGGLNWKRTLLEREGVRFVEPVPGRDGERSGPGLNSERSFSIVPIVLQLQRGPWTSSNLKRAPGSRPGC